MRRYPTNRYPGVNAHLNSYLLAKGKWENFHTEMIVQLRRQLDKILPSNYYAMGEDGLQLSFVDDDEIESSYVRPDVGILQSTPSQNPSAQDKSKPALSIPFKELEELEVEEALRRVGIYEFASDLTEGILVSTIEVLSPENKPHGSNYHNYLEKRAKQLQAGVNLVEIDLLHRNPPLLSRIPSYPRRMSNSVPYGILVNIPYPSFEEGKSD